MRKYPQPSDYVGAIQTPRIAFSDPELRASSVRTDKNTRMPRVSSGGFALSFYLDAPGGQTYVVRCFKAEIPDRQSRYAAICDFLNSHPHPLFLDVDYLEKGILVDGGWYPIVKMPYVKGMTFHRHIEGEITSNRSIRQLPDKFRRLVETLEKFGIAHGDLQHGNIMVQNGELVLIDYDCMYVPALARYRSEERGNSSYQHPDRNAQFGPDLDRFSSIAIDMALRALVEKPDLWTKYSNGDNMLFRETDFDNPDQSKLLRELESIPTLRQQVGAFRAICKGPLESVPRLSEFLAEKAGSIQHSVADWLPHTLRKRPTIHDGHNRSELLKLVGQQITVVGKITNFKEGRTVRETPYVFLNFGDYLDSHLTLVIWSEALDLFYQQGKQAAAYKEQWVRVNGLLTSYTPRDRDVQPQIQIDVPTQIEILQGGEAEARQLLAAASPQLSTPPSAVQSLAASSRTSSISAPQIPQAQVTPKPSPRPTRDIDQDLNRLYGAKVSKQAPSVASPVSVPPSNAPPVVQPSPAMAALGLHALPALLDFGQVRAIDMLSRQLRVFNTSADLSTISISGMDPYLTTTPAVVVCQPHSAVDITVRLDAARVPPGALQRVASAPSQGHVFALQGASLLLKCSFASQVIPVTVTIMHAVAPQSQPAPSGLSAPAQPAKTTPIAAAPPSAPRPTAPPPSQAAPPATAAAAQPAAGNLVTAPAQAQSPPRPAPSVPAAQTVPQPSTQPSAQPSTQASTRASTQPAVQPPAKSRSRFWNIAAWTAAAALCIAYFGSFGSFDAAFTQWRAYLAANSVPSTQAASSRNEPAPGGVAPNSTPLAAETATDTDSLASLCPADLPVELVQPTDFVIADTVTFAWQAGAEVPRGCLFQIKVWRDGRPRTAVDASGAAAGAGNRYEHRVALGGVLPAGERHAGIFSWTVELTLGDATGEALPTAVQPATFYWMPETSTDAQ